MTYATYQNPRSLAFWNLNSIQWFLRKRCLDTCMTCMSCMFVAARNEGTWMKDQRSVWHLELFQDFSHTNALGSKLYIYISIVIIHLSKIGRAHNPNDAYQVPRSLTFWFQRRFSYMSVAFILVMWPWTFVKNDKESPYEIWLKSAQYFLRKDVYVAVKNGLQYLSITNVSFRQTHLAVWVVKSLQ